MEVVILRRPQKASEYNQELQQLHTADQPSTSWGKATEHWLSQDIRRS